jgi:hypothetical protein
MKTFSLNPDIKTNSNTNKPVSFGFDASSWNYGAFYPVESYKSKSRSKVNVDYTPPINRDFKECYEYKNQPDKISNDTSKTPNIGRRVVNREEKIIRDDLVRNMNLLKLTGTSKNFSNKPTLVKNPVTNKIISNPNSIINNTSVVSPLNKNNTSKVSLNKEAYLRDNDNNMSRTSNTNSKLGPYNQEKENNQSKLKKSNSIISQNDSNLKYQLNYDEWRRVKKQQTQIEKSIKLVQEQENLKLDDLKKKIKEEYEPIKEEKLKKWIEEKKLKKKENIIKKLTKEEEIALVKEKKRIEKEQKMEQWLIKQAQVLELKEREKQYKEELEKRKKEQEEINKQTKKVESMNAYKIWKMKKEEERIILEQLKVQGYQMNNGVIVQPKDKKEVSKHSNRNKKLKLVIGPYTDAKVYRKIQRIIEDQLEDNENQYDIENQDEQQEDQDNYDNLNSADKFAANNVNTGETELDLNEQEMDNDIYQQNQFMDEEYNNENRDIYSHHDMDGNDAEINSHNHKLEQINEMINNNQEYDDENYEEVEYNNDHDNIEVYNEEDDLNNYQ